MLRTVLFAALLGCLFVACATEVHPPELPAEPRYTKISPTDSDTCSAGTIESSTGCVVPEPGWIDGPMDTLRTCTAFCGDFGYVCDPNAEQDMWVTTVVGGLVMTFVDDIGVSRTYEGAGCNVLPWESTTNGGEPYTLESYDCACVKEGDAGGGGGGGGGGTSAVSCGSQSMGGVGHSCSYAFSSCDDNATYDVVCQIQNVAGNVFSLCDCLVDNAKASEFASFDICSTTTWEATVDLVNSECSWDLSTDANTGEEGPACNGECNDSVWTACTCSSADPCGWNNDGFCDLEPVGASCDQFADHFPDDEDC